MMEVSTDLIKQAVYELCFNANICLNNDIYSKIFTAYNKEENEEIKNNLKFILQNAKIACKLKMPLCQDTGQVIVFLEIGQNILLKGNFLEDAINQAVENCYCNNFFRKSIVKNAVFDRTNTKTNTPCIIYTKYIKEDLIKLSVLIKGAGSENKSQLEMLLPVSDEDEIITVISNLILKTALNACPPMFIGIGIGETAEKALLNSKFALINDEFTNQERILANKIKQKINNNAPNPFKNCYVLDIKLKTSQTHIACMPAGITINCHSDRYSTAVIKNNEIIYEHKIPDFKEFKIDNFNKKEINSENIEELKLLKRGENILLTGELYIARDMAHKRLVNLLRENKELPFGLRNKIILYAGPCPNPANKIIGSIGPTTAERMDKYAYELYNQGLYGTIGKGNRSVELQDYILKNGKRYFTLQGGIAALLSQKIKKSEIIAFEDLETEAIYKIYADKLPVKVEI